MSNPAQPNTRTYTMGALMRFRNQTYADLVAAGITPPPFVENQNYGDDLTGVGEKGWADLDAKADDTGMVPYLIYQGANIVKTIHMPLDVAKNYNLKPSGMTYPAYSIATSNVTTSDGSTVPAERLSTMSQALQLAQSAGAGTPFIETEGGVLNYGSDTRRQWAISVNGQIINVGLALKSQNRAGVGHPGHFNFTPGTIGAEYFVLDPDPAPDTRPSVPIPVRAFEPNEGWGQIGLGSYVVVRSDIPDPNAPVAAPASDSAAIASLAKATADNGAKLDMILAFLESR